MLLRHGRFCGLETESWACKKPWITGWDNPRSRAFLRCGSSRPESYPVGGRVLQERCGLWCCKRQKEERCRKLMAVTLDKLARAQGDSGMWPCRECFRYTGQKPGLRVGQWMLRLVRGAAGVIYLPDILVIRARSVRPHVKYGCVHLRIITQGVMFVQSSVLAGEPTTSP